MFRTSVVGSSIPGERPRGLVHEAEVDVVLTDVLTSVPTEATLAAGDVERDRDVIAFGDGGHLRPGLDDRATGLVPEDLGRVGPVAEPVPLAPPAVSVAPTDPTAVYLRDHAVWLRLRPVDALFGQ